MPEFLTTSQVANRFEVTPETVRQWARTGKLPAVLTPSGQRKFRIEDVEAFFAPTEPT